MEFPLEIQAIIHEFAKPLTRPSWRHGSLCGFSMLTAPELLIITPLDKELLIINTLEKQYNSLIMTIPNMFTPKRCYTCDYVVNTTMFITPNEEPSTYLLMTKPNNNACKLIWDRIEYTNIYTSE